MTFQYHAAIIYACNNVKFLDRRNTSFGGNTLRTIDLVALCSWQRAVPWNWCVPFRLQINNIPVDGFDFDGMTP